MPQFVSYESDPPCPEIETLNRMQAVAVFHPHSLYFDCDEKKNSKWVNYVRKGGPIRCVFSSKRLKPKKKAFQTAPTAPSAMTPTARIWKLAEMDADHVSAWSKGGGTDIGNCQMLCKIHNRAKGNR